MSIATHPPKRRVSRHAAYQARQTWFFLILFSLLGIAAIVGLLFLANRPMLGH